MQKLLAIAAVALFAMPLLSHADEVVRSNSDCAELLERWAGDPKAAPRSEINACKDQLAAAPLAAPAAEPAEMAGLDPCGGPDAASSVLCWGPWATLAPAAAAPLVALELPESAVDCDVISEIAAQCVPQVEPVLPLEGCAPGTPCGFATIVAGFTSDGDPEDTTFARFNLAPDGSQFTVSPNGAPPINSVPGMETTVDPRDDGFENLRATGTVGNQESAVTARVVRDEDGEVLLAADVWTHVSSVEPTLVAQSGYFAWGTTTGQAGLNALNAGNVSLSFNGPMSVNNATNGSMTVKFGTNPTWAGTWTNPAWSFGAGGVVTGANLISQPGKFTDNVTGTGSFVQGAILGENSGARGIAHVIDVTLEGQGRIKDVGLLRDAITAVVVNP